MGNLIFVGKWRLAVWIQLLDSHHSWHTDGFPPPSELYSALKDNYICRTLKSKAQTG